MVFTPPKWVPKLPEPPDSIPLSEFILNEKYGRRCISESRDPYVCGLSGKRYTVLQLRDRRDKLARALSHELGWRVNVGSEYEKVAGIFCLNTIDLMMLSWAIHRLNGISTPANAAYSASELAFQLVNSGAKCLFTCTSLLPTALEAAKKANIPIGRIYLCPVPDSETPAVNVKAPPGMLSLDDFISEAEALPKLEDQIWSQGQGKRQTAFLCYSSGTSGLPKAVQISHHNVISNVLQKTIFERPWRKQHNNDATEVVMGALPFNHIYGLVIICHTSNYRGDQVVVLPKFDFHTFLNCIARFQIYELFVVPPIVITMTKNLEICRKHDLSSVKFLYTGAAPLGKETVEDLQIEYPDWIVCQAYGLTETATVVSSMSRSDVWPGSSGSLIPGVEARIVSADGKEIETYNTPGELWVKSPSVTLGYLNNEKATNESFIEDDRGRWLKTGDEVEFRKSPENGNEHLWVVDRIKELIKVKGNQVAPAELEAHLLTHPFVADCAVISMPSEEAGEVPKAYIVKSKNVGIKDSDAMVKRDIMRYVEEHKTRYKWVKAIEFIDIIPKSASGKILRRLLRDMDREQRKKQTFIARL